MKKVLFGALILSATLFIACDNDIESDAPSVSDYDFISFQDDNLESFKKETIMEPEFYCKWDFI